MLFSIPLSQCRQFLRNGGEQADYDADWCRFHVFAELVNDFPVLNIN